MARPIWSGTISFGLVNVPIQLVTLVRDRSIQLHMLNREGDCRLRRKLYCPESGEEYDFKDTARGYEVAPDQYVLIDQEELSKLRPDSGKALQITEFVDLASIDPVYFDRTYLLIPDQAGTNGYRLLVEAMGSLQKAAIGRFVMRQREYLAVIRTRDEALLLQTLHYADEVEGVDDVAGVPRGVATVKQEVQIAERLIEALSTDFDPAKYHDEYRQQLQELIEAKAQGEGVTIPFHAEEEIPPTYNIADALKESLNRAKENGSRSPAQWTRADASPTRQSTKRKSTGGKATGRNSTGQKTTGKVAHAPSSAAKGVKKAAPKGQKKATSARSGASKKARSVTRARSTMASAQRRKSA